MQLPLFKLEAFFEEFEFAQDMIVLGSSDAQTLTVSELLTMAQKPLVLSDLSLSYQDVKGDKSLRIAVAEMYRPANITDENVLITTGATEAIFLSLHAILKPHDIALISRPVFQSVCEVARMAGATVRSYDYQEENDFRPDLPSVYEALVGPNPPKLLFINTPHNPTGRLIDASSLETLVVKARNTLILVNEMYSGVWLPPAKPVPSALTFGSNVIVIAGLSKVFGLGGLRIGWLVGPTDFIRRCKELRYYTSLCPPAILQKLGEIAVRSRKRILERTTRTVWQNYQTVQQWLSEHQTLFDWIRPDAGLVMLIRLKREVDTDLFARELATKASVLLIPCTTFNMPEGYLRLGLGAEPAKFREGLKRLSEFGKAFVN